MIDLSKLGLANNVTDHTKTYKQEENEPVKYKFRAHCTSYACTKKHDYGYIIIPDAKRGQVDCHRCACALMWERYV